MSNLPSPILDEFDFPSWDALDRAQIELLPEQIQQAAQFSSLILDFEQCWQAYLAALATFGFQQWIRERSPELNTQFDQASIWREGYANLMAEACNIQVGAFKVCLIPVGNQIDHQIKVSIAAFDLPEFVAHFYVLVQVLEEEEKVGIVGFLNYNQFRQHLGALNPLSDWTYAVPFDWFNPNASALLLNFRCLEPSAMRLPVLEAPRSTIALREKLATQNLRDQLPWTVLSIEEGLTLLSDPSLVKLLYSDDPPSINVGLWFRDQIDEIAQNLGWLLLPSPGLPSLRSLEDDFEGIRSFLESEGVDIPATARGAYQILQFGQERFRLYAVTWIPLETSSEWVLLIALSTEPGSLMPQSLKLSIQDETEILFERTLQENNESVVYAQVLGSRNERFRVTVTVNQTNILEIPPFGFQVDAPN
ncbi:DUF1822 family protein [Leptolyngbya sp. AN03gr2]|uniref:DUF1822 family protein n=1 Tax=unclassified Leptolyngbya TaxID=2650499 RepID=UPI003D31CC07